MSNNHSKSWAEKHSKPYWLRKRVKSGSAEYEQTEKMLQRSKLHTVCQEANCPNIFECFSKKTATFLILGSRCTRNCTFCNVRNGSPEPPDSYEPGRIALAAAEMKLNYVVVTSVTRDDLADGGAEHFAKTIKSLKETIDGVKVEVLVPDFMGDTQALFSVIDAGPDVLNHNIETVPRLYPLVRPQADYSRSLSLLHAAKEYAPAVPTKSGLMLGLGEKEVEISVTLQNLREAGCDILTLGQYLQPTHNHHPVHNYVTPETFDHWRSVALKMGFTEAACGPFVRSSYKAKEAYGEVIRRL